MVTITATNAVDGIATDSLSAATLAGYALSNTSTTAFTITDTSPTLFDQQIIFHGSSLTYSGGFVSGGTITSAEVNYWNGSAWVKCADWTSMSVDGAAFGAAIQTSNTVALRVLLFGGDDTMNGADSFGDSLSGFDGADIINGNGGGDNLRGLGGNDTVHGGAGNDNVYSEFGVDSVYGDAGDDNVYATNSNDGNLYDGGADTDTLIAWSLSASTTIDLRTSSVEHFENITFNPAQINFTDIMLRLTDSQAEEFLSNAVITGSGWTDDTLWIADISGLLDLANWQFENWKTTNDINEPATNDIVRLDGGSGNDTIRAPHVGTQLNGGAGDDVLYGGAGADMYFGVVGDGADTMYGDEGNDSYAVTDVGDVVVEIAGEGSSDHANVYINNYVLAANVENMQLYGVATGNGNVLANYITGNALANTLNGGGGNDTLDGGADNDTLNGGAGADIAYGGDGNDTYVVNAAADQTIEVSSSGGTDTVQSAVRWTLGANIENLTLTGAAAINGTGNGLANVLTGNSAANVLNGAGGADQMFGGAGDDTYLVDQVGDKAIEALNEGADLVLSSVTHILGANVENLTLTGAGVIDGTGNALANVITGNNRANALTGGAGADTLNGGIGRDTLTGGLGVDKFVFSATAILANADTITDFAHNIDKVQLDDAVFGALGGVATSLAAEKFWVGVNAHDADDRIIYNAANGQLSYDADGNGSGAKVLIALLDPGLTLTASDFQVI